MNKLIFLALLTVALISCAHQDKSGDPFESYTNAALWFQKSAEARALSYQSYNIARQVIEQKLKVKRKLTPVVVLDLDETVLDNSPYQAREIVTGKGYPIGWKEWLEEANAHAIAGAIDFLNFVKGRGVEIFYVSNRRQKYFDVTKSNLLKLGAPFKEGHLLLRKEKSSKEERRQTIAKNYEIILMLGDNLNDFPPHFDGIDTIKRRFEQVDRLSAKFGVDYVVLPNPMYGKWLELIYDNDYSLNPAERYQRRRSKLRMK